MRLRFAKRGDLRLVSHHDLMRCLERMLRRAEIPMAHEPGVQPPPQDRPSPWPWPWGSRGAARWSSSTWPSRWSRPRCSAGSRPRRPARARLARRRGRRRPAARPQAEAVRYALPIPADRRDGARAALAALLASDELALHPAPARPRPSTIDLRPFLLEAELGPDGVLRFRLKMSPNGSARPEEVIDALGLRDLLGQGAVLVRTEVELAP